MGDVEVAVLTSYSTAALPGKIRELAHHGVKLIDIYCFFPEDLRVLLGYQKAPRHFSQCLDQISPSSFANKIAGWVNGVDAKTPMDICGIATFVPGISSPDKRTRKDALKFLQKMLDLMFCLRRSPWNFACDTLELVAGHAIQKIPQDDLPCDASKANPDTEPPPVYLKQTDSVCQDFLVSSLSDLQETINSKGKWPRGKASRCPKPLLAVEIEPSVSRLLHKPESVRAFLRRVEDFPNVAMNLDIGHARIIGLDRESVDRWHQRIAHCHVSDNCLSHFADLEVGTMMPEEEYRNWLADLCRWRKEGDGVYAGRVSIEMEACGSVEAAIRSYRKVKGWLGAT